MSMVAQNDCRRFENMKDSPVHVHVMKKRLKSPMPNSIVPNSSITRNDSQSKKKIVATTMPTTIVHAPTTLPAVLLSLWLGEDVPDVPGLVAVAEPDVSVSVSEAGDVRVLVGKLVWVETPPVIVVPEIGMGSVIVVLLRIGGVLPIIPEMAVPVTLPVMLSLG